MTLTSERVVWMFRSKTKYELIRGDKVLGFVFKADDMWVAKINTYVLSGDSSCQACMKVVESQLRLRGDL